MSWLPLIQESKIRINFGFYVIKTLKLNTVNFSTPTFKFFNIFKLL